ncbi:MAG: DUF1801 domain-containing protein [Flavobacteriales bacterium]|nr:DUF1801 domain-containing protein [Flavobacteriales bacterium]
MTSKATTTEQYLAEVSADKAEATKRLHDTIVKSLPKGFEAIMNYGMIGYVVPHKLYPNGYHCDPKLPLPFGGLAAQKNAISFYHMGIYADPKLLKWFQSEYPKHTKTKLDMGKSCIRFKKPDDIPYKLIGELMKKMSVKDWISLYEKGLKK